MQKLTEKQKKFCHFYIETANATESYKKSGYKCNSENAYNVNAIRLLRNDKIKAYLKEFMEKNDTNRIAKAEEVLEYFTKVMRGETLSNVVVVEGCGDGVSEAREFKKKPDEKERLDAAKQLAKRYGLDRIKEDTVSEVVQIVDDL